MAALAAEAGLQVDECRYACVENVNRRANLHLRRVFLHAALRRPL
jgi:hypothetical protein